jgi:hypothetical protein
MGRKTGKTSSGYYYNLFLGKIRQVQFRHSPVFADDKYDQRDMGYFTNNNYVTHGFWSGYKWLKPKSFTITSI